MAKLGDTALVWFEPIHATRARTDPDTAIVADNHVVDRVVGQAARAVRCLSIGGQRVDSGSSRYNPHLYVPIHSLPAASGVIAVTYGLRRLDRPLPPDSAHLSALAIDQIQPWSISDLATARILITALTFSLARLVAASERVDRPTRPIEVGHKNLARQWPPRPGPSDQSAREHRVVDQAERIVRTAQS